MTHLRHAARLFATALLAISLSAQIKSKAERPFYMGFTPWPSDFTPEAVADMYRFLGQNSDIIAEHVEGVPWTEALDGRPFSEGLTNDWNGRKNSIPAHAKVYLAISPLNGTRSGLADYRGTSEHMPLPAEFQNKPLNDEMVKKAYLNYCRRAFEFFKPDFMAIGIETNELFRNGHAQWPAYVELHRYVYRELKHEHPELPIFISLTLHTLYADSREHGDEMAQSLRPLMDSNDLVAISFYPFFKRLSSDVDEAFAWVAREFDGYGKPYAIAETGESAARIAFQSDGTEVVLDGSPAAQVSYYRKLLAFAEAKQFRFVISFMYKDYDALWKKIKQSSQAWFEVWRACGFLDPDGVKRPAYDVWNEYFARKLSTSPATEAIAVGPGERIDLDGEWEFSIHGRARRKITVPSSYAPVGGATLERDFDAPASGGRRALLRFGGLLMTGEVWLNDRRLGAYGPWTPFTIDATDALRPGSNRLRVELSDLDGFDPWNRNWVTAIPRFGGIIRDVALEWKSPVYIDNARLDYKLTNNYTDASCELRVWVLNSESAPARVTISGALIRGDRTRGDRTRSDRTLPFSASLVVEPGISMQTIAFTAPGIALWAPDTPNLYDLTVRLDRGGSGVDTFAVITGFREFSARGRDFYLNGQRFFLKGLFRHDIFGNQGYTLTPAQMETEMLDIKSLGCNFVRLGHYPHNGRIVELAARHGLLVSGEPPVFGVSQKDPRVVEGAKFSLGGLIRRDWNNPAVAVWFVSNEAGTDLDYMKTMSAFVRGLDPGRLVSIVDNTKWTAADAPWGKFREAKIDFIAQNAYGAAFDGSYEKIEKILPADLPYVISEWGGTSNSYRDVLNEGKYYLAHSRIEHPDVPGIAGISFWEYQDIPMARWSPEGTLHWSLVDRDRVPYEAYYALKTLYTGKQELPPHGRRFAPPAAEQLPEPAAPFEKHPGYETIDLSHAVNSGDVLARLNAISPLAWPEHLALGEVVVDGLPFLLEKQLVMLSNGTPSVHIPVGRAASEIEFLGQVCFNSLAKKPPAGFAEMPFLSEVFGAESPPPFRGYPQAGEFGEQAAEYVITYEDGATESIPLRNGMELADYRMFYGLSFINPIAAETRGALSYKSDFGTKMYQMRLLSLHPKRQDVRIVSIDFNLKNPAYVPILAAITLQEYAPVDRSIHNP
jgi:hypothetical protein